MEIQVDRLKLPIWILDKNLHKAEKVSKHIYLQATSNLSIKNKAFENIYLLDDKQELFIIKKIIPVGNLNPIWAFEFFNPMKKIIIEGDCINDQEIKEKVNFLVQQEKERLPDETIEV